MSTALDATGFPERGAELVKKVETHIAGTQRFIIHELPSEIYITDEQFQSMIKAKNGTSYLSSVSDTSIAFGKVKKAYIFFTPLNAMDVVVIDNNERNLPEAGKIITDDKA